MIHIVAHPVAAVGKRCEGHAEGICGADDFTAVLRHLISAAAFAGEVGLRHGSLRTLCVVVFDNIVAYAVIVIAAPYCEVALNGHLMPVLCPRSCGVAAVGSLQIVFIKGEASARHGENGYLKAHLLSQTAQG